METVRNDKGLRLLIGDGVFDCELPRRWFDPWAVLGIFVGQLLIFVGAYLFLVRRPEWGWTAVAFAAAAAIVGGIVIVGILYWCLMWERVEMTPAHIRVEHHFLFFCRSGQLPLAAIQQVDAACGDVSEDGVHCRQIVCHGPDRVLRFGATLSVADSAWLHHRLLQQMAAWVAA